MEMTLNDQLDMIAPVNIVNSEVQRVDNFKIVDVAVDKNLKFTKHIHKIVNKYHAKMLCKWSAHPSIDWQLHAAAQLVSIIENGNF